MVCDFPMNFSDSISTFVKNQVDKYIDKYFLELECPYPDTTTPSFEYIDNIENRAKYFPHEFFEFKFREKVVKIMCKTNRTSDDPEYDLGSITYYIACFNYNPIRYNFGKVSFAKWCTGCNTNNFNLVIRYFIDICRDILEKEFNNILEDIGELF